jgi:hypothetical protein
MVMEMNKIRDTYNFNKDLSQSIFNTPKFYELKFMPVYDYEAELGLSTMEKLDMLKKVIDYLKAKNINVTFTDRIMDENKTWERISDNNWRYLPIAELQGNNICINPRNIDFLSVFLSIGHIYGHLVQRMDEEKYAPITDFLDLPKPLDLDYVLSEYKYKYGGDYKKDFLDFEIEAFRYAKYTFIEAGITFTPELDYAMNVYIESDFNELWKWVTTSPQKSGNTFMDEFIRNWGNNKGKYTALEPKEINIKVEANPEGSLIVVRDEHLYQ